MGEEYRNWTNELIHVPGGHPPRSRPTPGYFGIRMCSEHSSFCRSRLCQCGRTQCLPTDLFLFKDIVLGGVLSILIGRMNDPDIGGFDGFFLPDPVSTRYQSFYDDYMAYIKVAERDSVLAAQIASPGLR